MGRSREPESADIGLSRRRFVSIRAFPAVSGVTGGRLANGLLICLSRSNINMMRLMRRKKYLTYSRCAKSTAVIRWAVRLCSHLTNVSLVVSRPHRRQRVDACQARAN